MCMTKINKPKLELSGDADWKTTHEYCLVSGGIVTILETWLLYLHIVVLVLISPDIIL